MQSASTLVQSQATVFRVSYRVQAVGIASLLAVPLILVAVMWGLAEASPGSPPSERLCI